MSNNPHQLQFPPFFDNIPQNPISTLNIQQTFQHTFDYRNIHHRTGETNFKVADYRTEDQVRNDLNFSIEDLLNKISKATADFQQPSKFKSPTQKQHPLNSSFKISNLSASTETNSNQQPSEHIIEKQLPLIEINKKRESEPQKEVFSTNDRFRQGQGQKQNSVSNGFGELRKELRNELTQEQNSSWNSIMKSDAHIQFVQPDSNKQSLQEWGGNSQRNQPSFMQVNNSLEQINQWGKSSLRNQPIHIFIEPEFVNQWSRNSSQNQFNMDTINQNIFTEPTQQWGRNSSRNQPKLNQVHSFKNIPDIPSIPLQKPELNRTISKQQICSPFETQLKVQPSKIQKAPINPFRHPSLAAIPAKREIQALLNPFQSSGFGKKPHDLQKKPQKTRHIAASIIIEDEPPKQQCQEIFIEQDKKVNSLFDSKKIREVAASRIMESPQKIKKKKNTQSPFMQITKSKSNDPIKEQDASMSSKQEIPMIKITSVQKSEIIEEKSGPKLRIQDFQLGKQLGSGKFGDVYQAIHKASGVLYAIKKVFKSTIIEYNMIEQFTRQLKIHYTLNYPNIIKLYTHFDDEYHIFLVMEYGEGGMLMERVKNGEKFASVIVEQMLRAVEYLQNKKIAHRDIKPQNIVLMFGDTAKMCDFGWSRVFDSDMKKTFCGTLDYVSPEMKDKGEYSLKIDIWSLGVLTFELLCGYAPFKDEITNWKRKGGNLNKSWNWNILYPPQISSVAESFMRNLLKQNPNQRANIRFCLNHLFIRKYNQMAFDEEEDRRFKEIAYILRDDN